MFFQPERVILFGKEVLRKEGESRMIVDY